MLMDRIIGAFTFRKDVYAEVEKDTSFTTTAWLLVIVVNFLSQFGTRSFQGFGGRIFGALIGTVISVISFAVAVFIISWLGKQLFNADVTFDELVRTLGLASVWNVVGFIGILAAFSRTLSCLLAPVTFAAVILGLIAWLFAAREALDLDWGKTIVTVIIGWAIMLVISLLIGGLILGAMGLTAAAASTVLRP
jgi:hypothetical protein